jgi:hypothetical protein
MMWNVWEVLRDKLEYLELEIFLGKEFESRNYSTEISSCKNHL